MQRLECSDGEGFYLGYPMPACEFCNLVEEDLSILS